MLVQPRLASSFEARVIDHRTVELLSTQDNAILHGAAYVHLILAIDSGRTVDQILSSVTKTTAREKLLLALDRLERRGVLVDGADPSRTIAEAIWDASAIPLAMARARNDAFSAEVIAFGSARPEPITALLRQSGLRLGTPSDLSIVVLDDYLDRAALDALRDHPHPVLLVKPSGRFRWMGPLVIPGETACVTCLAFWIATNRAIGRGSVFHSPPMPEVPNLGYCGERLVSEVAQRVIDREGALRDTVETFDTATLHAVRHTVIRRPQCEQCGDPAMEQEPMLYSLGFPREADETADARNASEDALLSQLRRFVSPLTGIVSSVISRRAPNLERVMLFAAYHLEPAATSPVSDQIGGPSISFGKGFGPARAEISCLAEALERYALQFRGVEPRRRSTMEDLGALAIDPRSLLPFSPAQFASRDDWNKTHSPFHHVPEPFDALEPLDWTPVQSLLDGQMRYAPTAFCFMRYFDFEGARFGFADTNGCAAGSTIDDALLHGLYEIIERDAFALWWYNRVRRPEISIPETMTRIVEVAAALKRNGRSFAALDLTTEFSVPVFVAVSADADGRRVALGAGADADPEVALTRATTEMAQMLAWEDGGYNSSSRANSVAGEIAAWMRESSLYGLPYLQPAGQVAFPTVPPPARAPERLSAIVRTLSDHGYAPFGLNLTRPEVALPTVRVLVPGLCHWWRRLGAQRLYEAPVQLDWASHRLSEAELNPLSFTW